MKTPLHIVKIGGALIDDPALLEAFLVAFTQLRPPAILVHGGGKEATKLSKKLGIETKMIDGRRITDGATLEVAVMVYAGLINKKIVAMLQAMGINALGLSGADGNIILAHKRPVKDIDYGFVGDMEAVNTVGLHKFIQAGYTPVFAPLTHDGMGQMLNTNADTIASTLASAMAGIFDVSLSYCFEHKGVLKSMTSPEESSYPVLRNSDMVRLQGEGRIHSGMIPKIHNALQASKLGATNVFICGIENLACKTDATKIVWNETTA